MAPDPVPYPPTALGGLRQQLLWTLSLRQSISPVGNVYAMLLPGEASGTMPLLWVTPCSGSQMQGWPFLAGTQHPRSLSREAQGPVSSAMLIQGGAVGHGRAGQCLQRVARPGTGAHWHPGEQGGCFWVQAAPAQGFVSMCGECFAAVHPRPHC